MTRKVPKEKKAECIRLRVQQQLSTPQIARQVGLSNCSVYAILKKHPWSGVRVMGGARATWSGSECDALRRLWATADPEEIMTAIPNRKWSNIGRKACALKLRRRLPGARKNRRPIPALIVQLRNIREQREMTRPEVAKLAGYHHMQLHGWEMGKRCPIFWKLMDWADALGFEIVLKPKLREVSQASEISAPSKDKLMAGR